MATNTIPKSYDQLIEQLEDAGDGAATHGAAVGLKQNDEAALRATLEALTGKPAVGNAPAVPGHKATWNDAKANKTAKTGHLRTAVSNGRTLLMTCIATLKAAFGQKWNSQWNAVGFTDNSLAVPDNPMIKLQQLRAFYAANPPREVANVNGIACTAAACEAAAQAIGAAQSDSNQSNTDAGNAKAKLEAGVEAARRRLTGLREELTQLLDENDERWYAFGFEKPGDPSTPEVPENLVVTPGAAGSGMVFANWDDARRADSYRVRVLNTAGNVELLSQLTQESELTVGNLPAGATVALTVTARNAAGETQPTAAVTIQVP